MLKNLRSLKSDIIDKKWTISSFMFNYNKVDYVVLVKLFVGLEKK